jgi:trk system potassium uptake protein TrkH
MHLVLTSRILGILLMIFSLAMLPPILVGWIYEDGGVEAFSIAFGINVIAGFLLWYPARRYRKELSVRDGFMVTLMFWLVLALFGSFPLMLSEQPGLSFTDAFFESLSGLTTTGATVITGLDNLPHSILFYRQQLQWLGGMGIIVLAVAILPMLGIGGMQLYRAETPGPMKDSKLTPRITETAKALWYIYLSLTVTCALGYWLAGMNAFDALCHSFATVAIGGFSTYDASIGHFNSTAIELICVFFMIISAINFSLHFLSWRRHSFIYYWKDPETRFFLGILTLAIFVTGITLATTQAMSESEAWSRAIFEVVSIATTTGFGVDDFSTWPSYLPFLLFSLAFMGGCAGSTGGGMKVIRILLVIKQGLREIRRLLHPSAVIPIKVGRKPVPDRVIEAVWGFFSVYIITFIGLQIMLLMTGLDMVTAWSAVGACMNNLGPGLGAVAANYGEINDAAKWILSAAMLLGRLEVFTVLVLFIPDFWER